MNQTDRVQICYCVQDRSGSYCGYLGASIMSVAENTEALLHFQIIHDDSVSEDSKERLRKTAQRYDAEISFYQIDLGSLNLENEWFELYSMGSLFRLMIPDLMPELGKMIYLDADIMFLRNIADLWKLDVSDYCLAGVHDIGFERGIRLSPIIRDGSVEQSRYINSGVLIMNLENIREYGNLFEMGVDYIRNHRDTFLPDQDALNYLFRDEILILNGVWNCFTKYERLSDKTKKDKVYHYAGEQVVSFANLTEYDKKYLQLRQTSEWGYELVSEEMIAACDLASIRVKHLQKLMKKLSDPSVKKIFWGYECGSVNALCAMLTLKEGDYFIRHDEEDRTQMRKGLPVRTPQDLQNEEKGSFVVFYLPEAEKGLAVQMMETFGMKREEDFFNIPLLMTYEQGGYIQ